MRQATACLQCRTRKVSCRQSTTAPSCRSCHRKNLACSFAETTPSGARIIVCEYPDNVLHLVELYLHHIHDRPHSLFHEPTLRASIEEKSAGTALVLSICALGCGFDGESTVRNKRAVFAQAARTIVWNEFEDVSLERLQTVILLANLAGAEEQPASEALYFSMALRLSQVLKLTVCSESDDSVLQEVKKRVFLSLFTADRWHSFGLALPTQIEDDEMQLSPAVDESLFHQASFGSHIPSSAQPGLWAYRTELAKIFGHIQSFITALVRGAAEDNPETTASNLAQELDHWKVHLPERLRMNAVNLQIWRDKGQEGQFVDLHLGFHFYCMLLLFRYLGKQMPSQTHHHLSAVRCKDHALEFSRLLSYAHNSTDCQTVHSTVGHMTVISSSVLLYFLLADVEEEQAQLRSSLVSNFKALVQLQAYWPNLTRWIRRLFVFQETCISWIQNETIEMDAWMLRFLLEYALPLNPWEATSTMATSPSRTPGHLVIETAASHLTPNWQPLDVDELLGML